MSEKVRTRPRTGVSVTWDGTNLDEIREVAGDRFAGVWETMALIRNDRGSVTHLAPGWSVTRWDEDGEISVFATGAAPIIQEPDMSAGTGGGSEITILREKVKNQAAQLDTMRLSAEKRNRELDALHFVWCDGGCPSGVHRFQYDNVLVTAELAEIAECNTRRLRHWYESVKFRYETYGPNPHNSTQQLPGTDSEWHRQYSEEAAKRTDLIAQSEKRKSQENLTGTENSDILKNTEGQY